MQGSCSSLGYYHRGLIKTQDGQPCRNNVVKKPLEKNRCFPLQLQSTAPDFKGSFLTTISPLLCWHANHWALRFPTHCFPGEALAGFLSTFLWVPGALPSYSRGLCPAFTENARCLSIGCSGCDPHPSHRTSHALPRRTCAFLFSDLLIVAPHSSLDKSPLGFLLEDVIVRNEVWKKKKK